MIRVLWFVNAAFPAMYDRLSLPDPGERGWGWWMIALLRQMQTRTDVELGVVWASPLVTRRLKFKDQGVTYYCLPLARRGDSVAKRLVSLKVIRAFWRIAATLWAQDYSAALDVCHEAVEDFDPDVLHIHGTENFYGLLTPYVRKPALISLQGILTAYYPVYWGNMTLPLRLRFPELMWGWWQMRRGMQREKEIFEKNVFFAGRTDWDQACQRRLNPAGRYYTSGELLRAELYSEQWCLSTAEPYLVYTTTTPVPYKGVEVLLDAIAALRGRYPRVRARIGGPIPQTRYGRYLEQKARRMGLDHIVEFIGYVQVRRLAAELRRAHVYVLPSYIDNSPNNLCEAQLIGVPSVAAGVGGVPSLITERETGLLFAAGDAAGLAKQIAQIFDDESLAVRLSKQARSVALIRHDSHEIAANLMDTYHDVVAKGNTNLA